MKKSPLLIILFAILFLFIIQSIGTLVESIYILDLMNSSLDEKALGVLFFFTPLLALPFYKKNPRLLVWILFANAVRLPWAYPLPQHQQPTGFLWHCHLCLPQLVLPAHQL